MNENTEKNSSLRDRDETIDRHGALAGVSIEEQELLLNSNIVIPHYNKDGNFTYDR
jgi:hypothetical protein